MSWVFSVIVIGSAIHWSINSYLHLHICLHYACRWPKSLIGDYSNQCIYVFRVVFKCCFIC